MPDNWGFVVAAYALAAVVLIGYWRMLVRRENELQELGSQTDRAQPGARSRTAPIAGRPRPKPDSRHSLQ